MASLSITDYSSPTTDSSVPRSPRKKPSREIPKYSQVTLKHSDQLVTLFAGDDPKKFIAHKDFACHYSPVLRAAFNSNFVEGQTQEYRLQDTTVDAVHQLVNWLYTQKLDICQLGPEGNLKSDGVDKDLKCQEDVTLVEVWILAEKLLIPRLQNLVIVEMQRVRKQSCLLMRKSVYAFIYEKTEDGSALRRYAASSCATSPCVKNFLDKYPMQMVMDMFVLLHENLTLPVIRAVKAEFNMANFQVPED